MIRALGISAGILLVLGGAGVAAGGLARSRRRTVRRLEALLSDRQARPATDSAQPALAAVWAELARRADSASRGTALAERMGALAERAGWPLRPGEVLVLLVSAALAAALLFGLLAGALGALLGAAAAPALVVAVSRTLGGRRVRALEGQLPDLLDQLSCSLRSGYALMQALEVAAAATPAPLGPELARALAETRVGRPLDEALAQLAARAGSTDLRWAVLAMAIQSRTGGTLSDILDVLAEFFRDREELRREVRALTADGRFSAAILTALPLFVTGVLLVLRPSYLSPLAVEPAGRMLAAAAAGLLVGATVWLRRAVRIEV